MHLNTYLNPRNDRPVSDFEYTPLQSAMETNNSDMVRLLLQDPRLDLVSIVIIIFCIFHCYIDKARPVVNGRGDTPLHLAVEAGSVTAIAELGKSPRCNAAIVNKRDDFGFTPLLLASSLSRLSKYSLRSLLIIMYIILGCLMLFEDLPTNFFITDYEGLNVQDHAGNGMVETYLRMRFRQVPSLLDVAARAVASLVKTELNLENGAIELPEAVKRRVLIYIDYME